MPKWKCVFSVDTRRTEQIVLAPTRIDARKINEAQYRGCKITWWSCVSI